MPPPDVGFPPDVSRTDAGAPSADAGGCPAGQHDGGDGTCVPEGTCAPCYDQRVDGPCELRIVTLEFAGLASEVEDEYGMGPIEIAVGSPFTGQYTYDLWTEDSNSLDTVADYWHDGPPYGIEVIIEGYRFATDPDQTRFLMELADDHGLPTPTHNYLLRSYRNITPIDLDGIHIAWQLDDPTANALDSVALSASPVNLERWQSVFGLTIDGMAGGRVPAGYRLRGHVDFIADGGCLQ